MVSPFAASASSINKWMSSGKVIFYVCITNVQKKKEDPNKSFTRENSHTNGFLAYTFGAS